MASDGGETSNEPAPSASGERVMLLKLVDGILIDPSDPSSQTDTDDATESSVGSRASVEGIDIAIYDTLATSVVGPNWTCPGAAVNSSKCGSPGKDPRCVHSSYGATISPQEAEDKIGPDLDGGLIYTIKILPNDYNKIEGKLKHLEKIDYDAKTKSPKPRRKMPFPVTAMDFFSSIVMIGKPIVESYGEAGYNDLWDRDVRHTIRDLSIEERGHSPRWVLSGVINGWPGLPCLEVMKIEGRETGFIGRHKGWTDLWRRGKEGRQAGKGPSYSKTSYEIRATMRAPEWTAHGWSADSQGYFYWVTGREKGQSSAPLTVNYGTNLLEYFKCPEEEDPLCVRVHMISHRYAMGKKAETQKDKLTYHSFVLLEWDHGKNCTVVEIGYLNGLGGYKCHSNWYDDKDNAETELYRAIPPEMVLPWHTNISEIRAHDVPYSDIEEFKGFMKKHEGHGGRFVDIQHTFSHDVRLTYRSRRNIAAYLLNYIRRNTTYSEMKRNCQTLAADFCGFLAGKKDVFPFHPVNQIQYAPQKHKFLYESAMY
jgi:hypothetical protein